MSKMMGANYKKGVCCCGDCGGPEPRGRAKEKQEWVTDAEFAAAMIREVERMGDGFWSEKWDD